MSYKRLRIVVMVLILACAFMTLVGNVHVAEFARTEPRFEVSAAPFPGATGGFWIMGGCEECSSGCPN